MKNAKINGSCSLPDCEAPDEECNLGHQIKECQNFSQAANNSRAEAKQNEQKPMLDWTGRSLGLKDLSSVAVRNTGRVIGILGLSDAGKTTLLGMLYGFVYQGRAIGNNRFTGSLTLETWEDIAGFMKWRGTTPPGFPPHTTSANERVPGLLHLAFRRGVENARDFLFSDAPGEWFKRWALNADAADAEGARWLARHADALVLLIDCEALSGENRGANRAIYDRLINRLNDNREGRPLAVVWSKADCAEDEQIAAVIKKRLDRVFGDYEEFHVSVKKDSEQNSPTIEEFARLFAWMLESTTQPSQFSFAPPPRVGDDLMLSFRG
jgi:hypothetical protein